jgi:protocatechuate 3,4-dioxygenase beta subunit
MKTMTMQTRKTRGRTRMNGKRSTSLVLERLEQRVLLDALDTTFGVQQEIAEGQDVVWGAYDVYAADLDEDGRVDVLSASYMGDEIAWFRNLGSGNEWSKQVIADGEQADGAQNVFAAQLDGVGGLDVGFVASLAHMTAWRANLGGGVFGGGGNIGGETTGLADMSTAYVDGDDRLDVVVSSLTGQKVLWYSYDDNFAEAKPITMRSGGASSVDGGYINDDGYWDLVAPAVLYGEVRWYENLDGSGVFKSYWPGETAVDDAPGPMAAIVVDVNGDGWDDVVSASAGDDTVRVRLNTKSSPGTFEDLSITIDNTRESPRALYAHDLDMDGDIDIVAGYYSSDGVVWYENQNGGRKWVDHQVSSATGGVQSVFVADIDDDGSPDILSASPIDNKVAWYRNKLGPTVSGTVWNDLDGDGFRDALEPGLSGLTVTGDGGQTTTTDGSGEYTLTGLSVGEHTISVTHAGWQPKSPVGGSQSVTLMGGEQETGINFGFYEPITISGFVWHDLDGNGENDDGAGHGLSDWTVNLREPWGQIIDSYTTALDGRYEFTGLAPGTYTIEELPPPPPPPGSMLLVEEMDVSNPADGIYDGVTVRSGDEAAQYDFGHYQFATISGLKWNDLNADGVHDAWEPLVGTGLTIHLVGETGDGDDVDRSVETDADGQYLFEGVAPGIYTITENTDGDRWVCTSPGGSGYEDVPVFSGVPVTDKDFGNHDTERAAIRGVKWNDLDGEGIDGRGVKDPWEPGLEGWTIFLDANEDGILDPGEQSTPTGADGSYLFYDLEPGTYRIAEVLKEEGWEATWPGEQGEPALRYHAIEVQEQELGTIDDEGNDFGSHDPSHAAIWGVRWNDLDGDGKKDTGEPPLPEWNDLNDNGEKDADEPLLPEWTVFLDANGDGIPEHSTVTDADGYYAFTDLGVGTYTVYTVTEVASGWERTAPPGPGGTYTVEVAQGDLGSVLEEEEGYKFGHYKSPTIHVLVWADTNADGKKDAGEDGLEDWTIFLSGEEALSGTTDSDGRYAFEGLRPGTYTVAQSLRDGWGQSVPADGVYTVVVQSGDEEEKQFGNYAFGTVSGTVWEDMNGDGARAGDGSDGGLTGWTVTLGNEADTFLVQSMVTGAGGSYSFPSLKPDMYLVTVELQEDWVEYASQAAVGLVSGGERTVDVPVFQPGGLAGWVWEDDDADGVRELGESEVIAGWDVALSIGAEDLEMTTVSTTGLFTFAGLRPGTYTVTVTPEVDWHPSGEAPSDERQITVNSGDGVSTTLAPQINLGYYRHALISGHVWEDANVDGEKDIGEDVRSGQKVFLDADKDGVYDSGEMSRTTDADGRYSFGSLMPGSYIVVQEATTGWGWKSPADAAQAVTVRSGQKNEVVNFGNYRWGKVTGVVWEDTDGDGEKVAGEAGIPDVTVSLMGRTFNNIIYGADYPETAPPALTDVTNSDGTYTISVPPSSEYGYSVSVTLADPDNWRQTAPDTYNGARSSVIVTSGAEAGGVNFGFFQYGTISGTVWKDDDGDGTWKTGEPGVGGVEVYVDANGDAKWNWGEKRVTTSSEAGEEGEYAFKGLDPGSYKVRPTKIGSLWYVSSPEDEMHTVVVASGAESQAVDFGVYEYGSISGRMVEDTDGDGEIEGAEPGRSDFAIELHQVVDTVDTKLADAVTGSDGTYSFDSVAPGTGYFVRVRMAGWQATFPEEDEDYNQHENIAVLSDEAVEGIDFAGYQWGCIAGSVWNDYNQNGEFAVDYEPALSGWTVFLDVDGNGEKGAGEVSVTTTPDGRYEFTDLAPGDYTVVEVLDYPDTWEVSTEDGVSHVVTVTSDNEANWDFGNYEELPYYLIAQFVDPNDSTVTVTVLDMDDPAASTADVDPADVRVLFGAGGSVSYILFGKYGGSAMSNLGLIVSGASSVGLVLDQRYATGDEVEDVAFFASDAPVGQMLLNSGVTGYDVSGKIAGFTFPSDVDEDGEPDDLTDMGINVKGKLGTTIIGGEIAGDVVTGGLGLLLTRGGGVSGDLHFKGDGGPLIIDGDLTGRVRTDGGLSFVSVKNVTDARIDLGGDLGFLSATGAWTNSSLSASQLGFVSVSGQLSATAPDVHDILANTGYFFLLENRNFHLMNYPGYLGSETDTTINNVRVWVE